MSKRTWIGISARERDLLLVAMSALCKTEVNRTASINRLTAKLVHTPPHPEITVGVCGGQVQWTLGNPFPIRICDYDGESDEDLPDIDERGRRCRTWFEPENRKLTR